MQVGVVINKTDAKEVVRLIRNEIFSLNNAMYHLNRSIEPPLDIINKHSKKINKLEILEKKIKEQ